MKVIFLDVDGCLNQHEPLHADVLCGQIHPDKVARLNTILRTTGARIVLSSAWRYIVYRREATLAGIDWLFRSHGIFAGALIGITREDTMCRVGWCGSQSWPVDNERGQQIADWLAGERQIKPEDNDYFRDVAKVTLEEPIEGYVVIDDLDLGISEAGHPFVHVDGTVGLTDADVVRAIMMLKGEHS